MTRVVVVGSINMDLVAIAPRFPQPGETLLGQRFMTLHGGKGANQAVAAARLGAEVHLIGALGDDAFGVALRDGLHEAGVQTDHVRHIEHSSSGTASITVAGGENQIVVVPGANGEVSPQQVEAAHTLFSSADVVLVQLEIPLDTVAATLRLAHKLAIPVILNPAPAQALPAAMLRCASFITPNEHELATVLDADASVDFRRLMQGSPCPVVMTRGSEGAWYYEHDQPQHQTSFKVDLVDSTGAGDTFNAAFAVFLKEGLSAAVRKACAAAALSVTGIGARGGMPRLSELNALLAAQPD